MYIDNNNNRPKYFIVEGNIGAGKSTFLRIIKKYLNAEIIYEPHAAWQDISGDNLLEAFYNNPKRWAYTFQSYAFLTRTLELEKKINNKVNSNKNTIIVLERSIYSDRYCFAKNAFEMGYMTNLEWELYQKWFNVLAEKFTRKPDGFIYLQADPLICYNRLLKRDRFEEKNVSLSYLKLLGEKHDLWLLNKTDIPVLILSCDKDFEQSTELQKLLINKIIYFLENKYKINSNISLKQNMLL